MTDEQAQLAKGQAWDRYLRSKSELAAHESQFHTWEKKFYALSQRLKHLDLTAIEQDHAWLPRPEVFAKALEEYRVVVIEYARATAEARKHGFPVE
jgi:hypothetical protein